MYLSIFVKLLVFFDCSMHLKLGLHRYGGSLESPPSEHILQYFWRHLNESKPEQSRRQAKSRDEF